MIPYGRQSIAAEDIEAVLRVLRSDWLTQGPEVEEFERTVAGYCGAPHAVALANATAGLHLACLALGLGPGDRLWTSPNTFVASANCARYCGAEVDFVDIDPETANIDPRALAQRLESARRENRLPRVVVPVHFGGQPADLAAIAALAQEYGFQVIEDASHALGAEYQGRKIGGSEHTTMTVFSFHPVKIATTGEGGMVLTRDPELRERLASLRSHGITRDARRMERPSPGPWYYEQHALGFNYRMNDLEAALGRSQMGRLETFLARRRELAARYDHLLAGLPLRPLRQMAGTLSAFHLYVVRLDLATSGRTRAAVFQSMRDAGVGVNLHYIPVHTQPYYQRLGFRTGDYPEAERYAAEALTLPLYYDLGDKDQERVVEALARALGR